METITITFGDVAENHVGMEKIGRMAEHGLSIAQLRDVKRKFEDVGCVCELTDLNIVSDVEPAAVLVIRGGLDAFVSAHRTVRAMTRTHPTLLESPARQPVPHPKRCSNPSAHKRTPHPQISSSHPEAVQWKGRARPFCLSSPCPHDSPPHPQT